jgi:thiol-disulfide isomerase/thioredoxin
MNLSPTLQLPVEGHLPPFAGATGWINSEPLTPESLRGRPVLVQFWTFTCINWLRTLPYVRAWSEKYRDDGLVVVGVHTPEFEVERGVDHIRRAAQEMEIDYPIAIDSDYAVWDAFANRYWPALYFADAEGRIRHHRFGEGSYDQSEIVIQLLLAGAGVEDVSRELVSVEGAGAEAAPDWDDLESPETYLGYERGANFASPGGGAADRAREYEMPDELQLNRWALAGDWTVGREAAVLNAPGGRVAFRFRARDLHLVMGPAADGRPVRFRVLLDGEPPADARGVDVDEHGEGVVSEPRLHQLIRQPADVAERTFEITFLDPGVHAYVFTFG